MQYSLLTAKRLYKIYYPQWEVPFWNFTANNNLTFTEWYRTEDDKETGYYGLSNPNVIKFPPSFL